MYRYIPITRENRGHGRIAASIPGARHVNAVLADPVPPPTPPSSPVLPDFTVLTAFISADLVASMGYSQYFQGNMSASASFVLIEVDLYNDTQTTPSTSRDGTTALQLFGSGFRVVIAAASASASASASIKGFAANGSLTSNAALAKGETYGIDPTLLQGALQEIHDATEAENFDLDYLNKVSNAIGDLLTVVATKTLSPGTISGVLIPISPLYSELNFALAVNYAAGQMYYSNTLSACFSGAATVQAGAPYSDYPALSLPPFTMEDLLRRHLRRPGGHDAGDHPGEHEHGPEFRREPAGIQHGRRREVMSKFSQYPVLPYTDPTTNAVLSLRGAFPDSYVAVTPSSQLPSPSTPVTVHDYTGTSFGSCQLTATAALSLGYSQYFNFKSDASLTFMLCTAYVYKPVPVSSTTSVLTQLYYGAGFRMVVAAASADLSSAVDFKTFAANVQLKAIAPSVFVQAFGLQAAPATLAAGRPLVAASVGGFDATTYGAWQNASGYLGSLLTSPTTCDLSSARRCRHRYRQHVRRRHARPGDVSGAPEHPERQHEPQCLAGLHLEGAEQREQAVSEHVQRERVGLRLLRRPLRGLQRLGSCRRHRSEHGGVRGREDDLGGSKVAKTSVGARPTEGTARSGFRPIFCATQRRGRAPTHPA